MTEHAQLPSGSAAGWRSPRLWSIAAVGIITLGLISSTQSYLRFVHEGLPGSWPVAVAGNLPFWLATLLLFPAVVWGVHRVPPQGPEWKRALLVHGLLSLLFAAVQITLGLTLSGGVMWALGEAVPFAEVLAQLFLTYFAMSVAKYWALAGVVMAVDYHTTARERERQAARAEVRAAQLETHLERARLDWLRSQLNPHFLFNTLNTISTLAGRGRTDRVVTTLAHLGDLLRATLSHSALIVPLEQEVRLLEKFLDIERLRFGDRLTTRIDISPGAERAAVPSLLLQPLVENALKHGVGGVRGRAEVSVRARVVRGTLTLEVDDSGRGFPPSWTEGVGLSNTRKRLEQLYGHAASLAFRSRGPGALVVICLPYSLAVEEDVVGEPATFQLAARAAGS